ncbi:MAG: hypothetical protein E7236_01910 [Lachnospiraceae bacterium]|nr:hypothetical protein [Lachnospiraceae bacterium]
MADNDNMKRCPLLDWQNEKWIAKLEKELAEEYDVSCSGIQPPYRHVDYVEPASYFTPEMLKTAEEWEKEHSMNN